MNVKLLSYTKNPELLIATAAKLCYSSSDIEDLMKAQTTEEIDNFISKLEEYKHESPFEHVSYTFAIEGVSRVLEQQLTRHRISSFSIQSGRFVDRNNAQFYLPGDIENNELAKDIYIDVINHSKEAYENIYKALLHQYLLLECNTLNELEIFIDKLKEDRDYCFNWFKNNDNKKIREIFRNKKKKALENARFVFPNSLETKIIVTMNVRSLWNFFKHRCCFRAQDEIRELAFIMLSILKEVSPRIFKHAGTSCKIGICPEGNMQCQQLKGIIPTYKDIKELINKYYKDGRVI